MTGVRPATMLSRVDLPQPEWPMIETNSPLLDVRSMSRSTSDYGAAAVEDLVDVVELQIGACHGASFSWRRCRG